MRTAIVVGAGVAGLAAAGALTKAGWQVTLLERGDRLRGGGGAQLLWPNAINALRALGLNPGDLTFPAPPGGIRRPDGRWLVPPPAPRPQPADPGPVHPKPTVPVQREPGETAVLSPVRAYQAAGETVVQSAPGAVDPTALLPTVGATLPAVDPTTLLPTVGVTLPAAGAAPPTAGATLPATLAEPVLMHADDLHDLLMSGLGGKIEIRTAVEITQVRAGSDWPAVSTGKHTFSADLVVVADGANSVVRRRLLPGARVAPAGYTAWRALVPWFRAPRLPQDVPVAGEMLGQGMRLTHVVLGERWTAGEQTRGGIYWTATVPGAPRPEPVEAQLVLLRRWFAGWRSPAAELLAATEPSDLVPQPALALTEVPPKLAVPVGGGGFVFVGDAGHVMTPSLTQGAGLALEDAVTLGVVMRSAVPGSDTLARLDEYTRLRRERLVRVARLARRLDRVVQAQGRLAQAARDVVLARLHGQLVDRALAAAMEWDAPVAIG